MVPAVVLLRGLAREQGHWGEFVPKLTEQLCKQFSADLQMPVLLQDLPGMGQYHQEQSPAQMTEMALWLQRKLLERHPGPWHIVAMSLGAMLALQLVQQLAAQQTSGTDTSNPAATVRSLVLINTSVAALVPFYRRLRWQQYPKVLAALCGPVSLRERLILAMTSNSAASRASQLPQSLMLAQQRPPTRLNSLRQLWAASRFVLPARPTCPTLLLASSQDQLVDPLCSRLLAERWQLPLALHPWAGHDLALDDPQWLALQISSFYQSLLAIR